MKILAKNNLYHLENYKDKKLDIYWDVKSYSRAQSSFFDSIKQKLEASFDDINIREKFDIDELKLDYILSWDAFNEKSRYKSIILERQNYLIDKIDFPFKTSFSHFRKRIEKELPNKFKEATRPWDRELIKKLESYFSNESMYPSNYFETRNALVGENFSTGISPFLAIGSLDVRYFYNCIKEYEDIHGANKSTYWILVELIWREYFYHLYQEHQTNFFSHNGLTGPKDFGPVQEYSIDEVRNQTSSKFMLAALNELETTGYPSNRVRQLFASYWINELGLNWLSGAKLFEKRLIDYDVYSNYGNWLYIAGLATPNKPRAHFNIDEQLERYDPSGSYIKKWY